VDGRGGLVDRWDRKGVSGVGRGLHILRMLQMATQSSMPYMEEFHFQMAC
jgi:hypothetical protein